MKAIAIIIVTLSLAAITSAQLTYDEIRIKVPAGTTCPSGWTLETSTVVVAEEYSIHVPAVLGGLKISAACYRHHKRRSS